MPVYLVALRLQNSSDDRALIASSHAALGRHLEAAYEEHRYLVAGDLDRVAADRLVSALQLQSVVSTAASFQLDDLQPTEPAASWAIDVADRRDTSDNESLRAVHEQLGVANIHAVRSLRRVYLYGNLQYEMVEELALEFLANDLVEAALISLADDTSASAAFYAKMVDWPPQEEPLGDAVALRAADDPALSRLGHVGEVTLELQDMRAIQAYFRQVGREPTQHELETLAWVWAEEGQEATAALVRYQSPAIVDPDHEPNIPSTIDGISRTFLIEPSRAIQPPWLVASFVDDAGLVMVGSNVVSFAVEAHPLSALVSLDDPAMTVDRTLRELLDAPIHPIANLDVLCFPAPDLPYREPMPVGLAAGGVNSGTPADREQQGLPTAVGAALYDDAYLHNPLIFRARVGLAELNEPLPGVAAGDVLVVVGVRAGEDGWRKAIQERTIDVMLDARNHRLYHAITLCERGGLLAAVRKLGKQLGVRVELDDSLPDHAGSESMELWLGDGPGHLVAVVAPSKLDTFLDRCARQDVPVATIGTYTAEPRLVVSSAGQVLVDLETSLLDDGRPRHELQAIWRATSRDDGRDPDADPIGIRWALHQLLAHPNIAFKQRVVGAHGELDQGAGVWKLHPEASVHTLRRATVLPLRADASSRLAIGFGINPRYSELDPYWMALTCCDQALGQVVAAGGDPYRTSLISNFCWDDSREPEQLAGLVRAAAGCRDVACTWSTPFLSAISSAINAGHPLRERDVSMPSTLLISALAVVPNAHQVASSLQQEGNLLYLIGRTCHELGGSHYHMVHNERGGNVPRVDLIQARRSFRAVHAAIGAGLVRACLDISTGGLAIAAAEMCFSGSLGLDLDLTTVIVDDDCVNDAVVLFSETPSRFLVEVQPHASAAFGALMEGVEVSLVGFVTAEPVLRVDGLDGREVLREPIPVLKAIWQHVRKIGEIS